MIAHLSINFDIETIIVHGDCPPQSYSDLIKHIDIEPSVTRSAVSIHSIKTEKVLNELSKIIKVKNAIQIQKDGNLIDKTFMITGKLVNMSRAEAKSLIEESSGTIVSGVSKKLDYLIIGEKPTKRKIESAKELKIRILTQKEWSAMLKKTS